MSKPARDSSATASTSSTRLFCKRSTRDAYFFYDTRRRNSKTHSRVERSLGTLPDEHERGPVQLQRTRSTHRHHHCPEPERRPLTATDVWNDQHGNGSSRENTPRIPPSDSRGREAAGDWPLRERDELRAPPSSPHAKSRAHSRDPSLRRVKTPADAAPIESSALTLHLSQKPHRLQIPASPKTLLDHSSSIVATPDPLSTDSPEQPREEAAHPPRDGFALPGPMLPAEISKRRSTPSSTDPPERSPVSSLLPPAPVHQGFDKERGTLPRSRPGSATSSSSAYSDHAKAKIAATVDKGAWRRYGMISANAALFYAWLCCFRTPFRICREE